VGINGKIEQRARKKKLRKLGWKSGGMAQLPDALRGTRRYLPPGALPHLTSMLPQQQHSHGHSTRVLSSHSASSSVMAALQVSLDTPGVRASASPTKVRAGVKDNSTHGLPAFLHQHFYESNATCDATSEATKKSRYNLLGHFLSKCTAIQPMSTTG